MKAGLQFQAFLLLVMTHHFHNGCRSLMKIPVHDQQALKISIFTEIFMVALLIQPSPELTDMFILDDGTIHHGTRRVIKKAFDQADPVAVMPDLFFNINHANNNSLKLRVSHWPGNTGSGDVLRQQRNASALPADRYTAPRMQRSTAAKPHRCVLRPAVSPPGG